MRHTAQRALENLRLAIHGVTAPFFCAGTVVPDKPVALVFKDRTRFPVVRSDRPFEQSEALKPLLEHCKPAPFGDGKKTRYNRSVRDALQLKAEKGAFRVEHFDPEAAGILATVQRELVPHDSKSVIAELYTVNVYQEDGHFAPHKDTPRGDDMLGTLVVCLPAQFRGGDFVLTHRGIVQTFNWGHAIQAQEEPNQLHWVAFFGDVDHQIEHVWGGARVTLTYLLRRGAGAAPVDTSGHEHLAPRIQEAWRALLADKSILPTGGTVGYPCCHLYHQDARVQGQSRRLSRTSSTFLKGRDHLVAATALQAKLHVSFHPYMFENCADETWQLKHFPTTQEQAKLQWQMDESALEKALAIRASSETAGDFGVTWLEPRPSSMSQRQGKDNRDPELPAVAHLHSCDYCPWGYFGNESSEVDLYTFAALHITIPKVGEGARAAEKPARRVAAKGGHVTRKGRSKNP